MAAVPLVTAASSFPRVSLVTAASSFPRVSSARVEANLGQAVGASVDIGYRSSPFSSHGNLGKTSMSDIVQNVSGFPCILVQEFSLITISIVKMMQSLGPFTIKNEFVCCFNGFWPYLVDLHKWI